MGPSSLHSVVANGSTEPDSHWLITHQSQPAPNPNFWIQSQRLLIDLKCFRDLGLGTPVAPFVSWKDLER